MTQDEIIRAHSYWWQRLQQEIPALANRKTPPYRIDLGMHPDYRGGSCDREDGKCTYYLAYAETAPHNEYDVTICHELCHAAVLMLNPWAKRNSRHGHDPHGDLWQFLFNTLMRQDRGKGHSYNVLAAEQRAKELLDPNWQEGTP